MRITPHLNFNGQCRAAFERYRAVLGGTIPIMLSYGESPLAASYDARWRDLILHASLTLGDMELIGTDQFPDSYETPQGICITLNVPSADQGREVFDGLAAGGRIILPFAATFWSPGFGVLIDAFAIPWEINSAASET
jgi:PhnB protein